MGKDFFDSTLPYILLPLWLLGTIACVVWAMFPRYHIYERVGRYIYEKVLRRMEPKSKTRGEPNDRTTSEDTFMDDELSGYNGGHGTLAAEKEKKQQRRKMRERASTRTAWPISEEDEIELEDMSVRNVREFV